MFYELTNSDIIQISDVSIIILSEEVGIGYVGL